MATQLGIWNGALRLLGERKLASLTENREPRRLLDAVWSGGAVDYCLALGQWTFAMRTVMVDYSPSITPPFGYRYGFTQPDDMVKVAAVCSDEYFTQPLLRYADERRHWYADLQTIYVKYVSNHAQYGGDLALWPEAFSKVVEAYLAKEICENLTQSESKLERVERDFERTLTSARSLDAMNKPTQFMPVGSWEAARYGNRQRRSLWNGR